MKAPTKTMDTVQIYIQNSMQHTMKKNAILVHITKTQVTNEVLDFDSDFLYQRELNADMDFNEEIPDHKHISTKTQRTKRKIFYTRENLKTQIWISMKKLRFSTSKKT